MSCPLKIESYFYDITDKICIEIGVQKGDWAKELVKCGPKHLYLVDCWEHQDEKIYANDSSNVDNEQQNKLYDFVIQRFKNYNNVTVIKEYSANAVKLFEDGFFDFLYLDANHNTEYVYQDLNAWWSKVKIGGCMSGHDINNKWDKCVRTALNRFCLEKGVNFITLNRNSWGILK